jgi:branched-chain amino acid aminotransferase
VPEFQVYINGQLQPQSQATISVFDSAFNYGDGVFEGLRVYDGRVFALDEHLHRLYVSAKAVDITVPVSFDRLRDDILRWLQANEIRDDFHFRVVLTRGNRFPPRGDPRFVEGAGNIVFVGGPTRPGSDVGLRVLIARTRRTPPDCLDNKIKCCSFMNQVLTKLEAVRAGLDDALVLDIYGFLAEGATANVFLVRGGQLFTPWPKFCLAGITRGVIMRLAAESGYSVEERDLSTTDVYGADEIFLCGTSAEVSAVVEVDGKRVGEGLPGPITGHLGRLYATHVRSAGVPIYATTQRV